MTRRDVLRLGLAGAGLLALGPLGRHLSASTGGPLDLTRLVVLNLMGGNDTLNTVVPTTLKPYFERRPALAIAAEQGISLDSGPAPTTGYALHPALTNLASYLDYPAASPCITVGSR